MEKSFLQEGWVRRGNGNDGSRRNNVCHRKAETDLFGTIAAAGNGCHPRPRSHVCGGEFSHVAVRSCASRIGETFVHEPRLLQPSITLTPRERS